MTIIYSDAFLLLLHIFNKFLSIIINRKLRRGEIKDNYLFYLLSKYKFIEVFLLLEITFYVFAGDYIVYVV